MLGEYSIWAMNSVPMISQESKDAHMFFDSWNERSFALRAATVA